MKTVTFTRNWKHWRQPTKAVQYIAGREYDIANETADEAVKAGVLESDDGPDDSATDSGDDGAQE